MHPRSIQELCCIARATLFNICLSDQDLEELGFWESDDGHPAPCSPAVSSRVRLNRACQDDHLCAHRVTDRLDLQFMGTVLCIQQMDERCAEQTVDQWLGQIQGAALPGLLWALCSDPRPRVRGSGIRLCHEVVTLGCRGLVNGCLPVSTTEVP